MIQVIETNQELNIYDHENARRILSVVNKTSRTCIQKLHGFLKNENNGIIFQGHRYIYNTYEELAYILETSRTSVARTIKSLEETGLLISCQPFGSQGPKAYRINYDLLLVIIANKAKDIIRILKEKFQRIWKSTQYKSKEKPLTFNNPEYHFGPTYIHYTKNKSYKSESSTQEASFQKKDLEKKEDQPKEFKKENRYPCEEMLNYWNEGLGKALEVHERINPTIARNMNAFLKRKLKGNVELWKRYCDSFFEKPYLMKGHPKSGWKISLMWMLRFSSWEKYDGEVMSAYERENEVKNKAEQCVAAVVDHIQEVETTNGEEADLRKQVIESVGETSYSAWMKDVDIRIEENKIRVICPSSFIQDSLENKIFANIPDLDRIWSDYSVRIDVIDLSCKEKPPAHTVDNSGYERSEGSPLSAQHDPEILSEDTLCHYAHDDVLTSDMKCPETVENSHIIEKNKDLNMEIIPPAREKKYENTENENPEKQIISSDWASQFVRSNIHNSPDKSDISCHPKDEKFHKVKKDEDDHNQAKPDISCHPKGAWWKIFSFLIMFFMSFSQISAKDSSPIMTYKVSGSDGAKAQLLVFSSGSVASVIKD
jgi:DNA-binding transcriptional ArsR family regulator